MEQLRAAIYGRVSTEKQDYAGQVAELDTYAARCGWATEHYLEKESAKAGNNRPMLAKLLADCGMRKFDIVLVWKVDRFGRSLKEFIENILELDRLDVRFVAIAGGIDTDKRNPFSKLLMNLLAMFAEFELDLIHERTSGGLKRYMELERQGKIGPGLARESKSGKNLPVGRPTKIFRRDIALELRSKGASWGEISRALDVKVSTVRAALRKVA